MCLNLWKKKLFSKHACQNMLLPSFILFLIFPCVWGISLNICQKLGLFFFKGILKITNVWLFFTWLIFPSSQDQYSIRTVAVSRWLFIHSCPTKRAAWLCGLKPLPAEEIMRHMYCYEYPHMKVIQRVLHLENNGLLLPVSIYYTRRCFRKMSL